MNRQRKFKIEKKNPKIGKIRIDYPEDWSKSDINRHNKELKNALRNEGTILFLNHPPQHSKPVIHKVIKQKQSPFKFCR